MNRCSPGPRRLSPDPFVSVYEERFTDLCSLHLGCSYETISVCLCLQQRSVYVCLHRGFYRSAIAIWIVKLEITSPVYKQINLQIYKQIISRFINRAFVSLAQILSLSIYIISFSLYICI